MADNVKGGINVLLVCIPVVPPIAINVDVAVSDVGINDPLAGKVVIVFTVEFGEFNCAEYK